MNRRRFVELLTKTAAISTVAYSFPSVIRAQNTIQSPTTMVVGYFDGHTGIKRGTLHLWSNKGVWTVLGELPSDFRTSDILMQAEDSINPWR